MLLPEAALGKDAQFSSHNNITMPLTSSIEGMPFDPDRDRALAMMGSSNQDDDDANDDDDDDDDVLSDYDSPEEDPGESDPGGRGDAGARGSTTLGGSVRPRELIVGNGFVCDTHSCGMTFAGFDDLVDHRRLHVGCTILTSDDMQWTGQQASRWGSTRGQTHAAGDIKLEPVGGSHVTGGGACKSESGTEGALGVEGINDDGLLDDDAECGEDVRLERGPRGRGSQLPTMVGKGQLSAREMRRVKARIERMERSSRIAATERRNRRQVRVGSMTVKTEAERERVLALRVG